MIKLSICIPTFNRASYLDQTIQSIATSIEIYSQFQIEICISDNASTDNTENIVKKWMKVNEVTLRYKRNSINLGADANYLQCVDMASGDLCWLLGSDDLITHEILKSLSIKSEEDCDVYLLNRMLCEIDMTPVVKQDWLSDGVRKFIIYNKADLIGYFNRCLSLGGVFSYLSSIVFKRSRWDSIQDRNSANGTLYSHVYVLLQILMQYPSSIVSVEDAFVLNRQGNDSFSAGGDVSRYLIDVDGYLTLAKLLNLDDDVKVSLLSILRREYIFQKVLRLVKTAEITKPEVLDDLLEKLSELGYKDYEIYFLRYFPLVLYSILRKLKPLR